MATWKGWASEAATWAIAMLLLATLLWLLTGCVGGAHMRIGGKDGVEMAADVAVIKGNVTRSMTGDGSEMSMEARARVLEAIQALPGILSEIPMDQLMALIVRNSEAMRTLREERPRELAPPSPREAPCPEEKPADEPRMELPDDL